MNDFFMGQHKSCILSAETIALLCAKWSVAKSLKPVDHLGTCGDVADAYGTVGLLLGLGQ